MPKLSKAIVDSDIRAAILNQLDIANREGYHKINDRQYGVIVNDANNTPRYVRIGIIVAEERDDCTAQELMDSEIAVYNEKQAKKATKAAERAEKAEKDKAKREAAKKKKEKGE